MRKYKIPILTEEYYVNVFIGKRVEIIKAAKQYTGDKDVERWLGRGMAINGLDLEPKKPPAIFVIENSDIMLSTVAHEASHAVKYIEEYVHIKDTNGEFLAHGIAAVLRHVLRK